jgi:hypothetical protein
VHRGLVIYTNLQYTVIKLKKALVVLFLLVKQEQLKPQSHSPSQFAMLL